MRRGVHLKLLFGQRAPPTEVAPPPLASPEAPGGAAGQDERQASDADMDECGSCSESEAAAPTATLSQLPDAGPLAPREEQQRPAAEEGLAEELAGSIAGSTWYLCRVAVKGLHHGSREDGE